MLSVYKIQQRMTDPMDVKRQFVLLPTVRDFIIVDKERARGNI